jgi:hypothetical protein
VQERLERRFLTQEPQQRRQPGHRRRRQGGDQRQSGQRPSYSRELPDVPAAGALVEDPHHQEQWRLEQAVREQHGDPGQRGGPPAGAEQHHQEPELAHGAEREQPLEVGLVQRAPAAD